MKRMENPKTCQSRKTRKGTRIKDNNTIWISLVTKSEHLWAHTAQVIS